RGHRRRARATLERRRPGAAYLAPVRLSPRHLRSADAARDAAARLPRALTRLACPELPTLRPRGGLRVARGARPEPCGDGVRPRLPRGRPRSGPARTVDSDVGEPEPADTVEPDPRFGAGALRSARRVSLANCWWSTPRSTCHAARGGVGVGRAAEPAPAPVLDARELPARA